MASSSPGVFSFPQNFERAVGVLPRPLLNQLEIRGLPAFIPDKAFRTIKDFWTERRVALVRQSACLSGYLPGSKRAWQEEVLTSKYHLGPFAFLSDLGAESFVVKQDSTPETWLWWEKHAGDPDPVASKKIMESWISTQEEMEGVVASGDVRWEDYDLVVCLDVPVSSRLTYRAKKTLWAYYSVEAGGALHENSLLRPVPGYHLYLNHSFRRYRIRPRNRKHVLEFPFSFQSAEGWGELIRSVGMHDSPRIGAMVDKFSWIDVPPSTGPETLLTRLGQEGEHWPAKKCVEMLANRRFAIRTEPRKRWGNWSIEAVQAGCVFLGRAASVDMKGALLPELEVKDLREAQTRMNELLQQPEKLRALQQLQAAMVEHLAFRRPLADLTRRAQKFFSR